MTSEKIRESFISYFMRQGHTRVPSSPLVPMGDPTLLFTNAGMNQFKNTFLGQERRDYTRAVSAQKCVRAGGKHNDLENVGHTARHHTFFEMLGNFSFGDYFKKEAIHFAWEFLTRELQIPKDRLYVTVYNDDDEAADIWHKQESIPRERIFRFGQKDNFWRMGDTGPCGPCSEIFYDHGEKNTGIREEPLGESGDRFIEIWNLVFMQFNEDESGKLNPLPKPSVDTGAGLERLSAVMQGKVNNFETDLFWYLIEKVMEISGAEYVQDFRARARDPRLEETASAMRVLADHTRAIGFLIADGVLPSNEGRGYVLRRILRRGVRYGRKLSTESSFLPVLAETLIARMGRIYPELSHNSELILTTIKDEEQRFLLTLDSGTKLLQDALQNLSAGATLNGEIAFRLYDTYGFPLDLTELMAGESGIKVDTAEFDRQMEKARQIAKSSWKGRLPGGDAHLTELAQNASGIKKQTKFTGYETLQDQGQILLLSNGHEVVSQLKAGEHGFAILDQTCFYAESGGQVGDTGSMRLVGSPKNGEPLDAAVVNATKLHDIYFHEIHVNQGIIKAKDAVKLMVTESKRRAAANNHSATHLLHAALRQVLGTHVQQAGSLVTPERLRFDFSHNRPVSAAELTQIENLVNEQIGFCFDVKTNLMEPEQAIQAGALALFGEKYGSIVRVVQMGDFSTELCGGTHVSNTSHIRAFTIVAESGVSAGVRRIEALTGDAAIQYLSQLATEAKLVKKSLGIESSILEWTENAKLQIKALEKEIKHLKSKQININELIQNKKTINVSGKPANFLGAQVPVEDREVLSQLSDSLQSKLHPAVVILVGSGTPASPMVVSVSRELNPSLAAGKILKEITDLTGGKGGGRPDFAQGAVEDLTQVPNAIINVSHRLGSAD